LQQTAPQHQQEKTTITCVLGDQRYETLDIRNRKLLVIHGKTPTATFAIIPGWWSGNERYEEGNKLAAVDVELIDPIEQVSLEDEIKQRLSKGRDANAPGEVPRISFWGSRGVSIEGQEKPRTPSTVLVVDDDPAIREIIRIYLEKEGIKVQTASSAAEAEHILRSQKLPSLMLLDIMMPGATGWELLKRLEKDEKFAQLPVIAISGLERPQRAGSENDSKMLYDYLVKPFSLTELSRAVKKFAH
jgi:CheY-like chemotaxis protein